MAASFSRSSTPSMPARIIIRVVGTRVAEKQPPQAEHRQPDDQAKEEKA
jgi:hypothetical protein